MPVILRSEKGSELTQAEVDGNFTAVRNAETNISTLQSDVIAAESNIVTLQSDVATLQTDIDAAEANIVTLQTQMANAQADIATLQTDVGTLQTDVGALQTDVAAIQADVATLLADSTKLGEVFIPAPDFIAIDDINGNPGVNPRLGGADIGSFGANANTLPYQLFDNLTTGTATCVAWARTQLPSWNGQQFEVVFIGGSHTTTLPLPRNFRVLVDVIFVDEPATHLTQTLTLNFPTQEHVMGTFTATSSPFSPFAVAVRRDYDHVDDSNELMFFGAIKLRLVTP